ncbi:MAG: aldo/keto reductase, partial [Acidimicrobiales bacterium]
MTIIDKRLGPPGTASLAGHPIARTGFGAMQLGTRRASRPAKDTALAALRQSVELGANPVDTARSYGAGVANDATRTALRPYPEDLVTVSKVGANRMPTA